MIIVLILFVIKLSNTPRLDEKNWSATHNAVLRLVAAIPRSHRGVRIVFDNLFSKPHLFEEIHRRYGHYCVGTWRKNYGIPNAVFRAKLTKEKAKKLREEHERNGTSSLKLSISHQKKESDGSTVATSTALFAWGFIDSNSVHMLSTIPFAVKELRGGMKEKKILAIQHYYNNCMCHVDVLDQIWNSYTVYTRSPRWWFRIFCFFIDVTVSCIMIMWNLTHEKPLSHKDCIVKLIEELANFKFHSRSKVYDACEEREARLMKKNKRRRVSWGVSEAAGGHHGYSELIVVNDVIKFRRCRYCTSIGIRKDTKYQCDNCKISLCPEHMELWHTN